VTGSRRDIAGSDSPFARAVEMLATHPHFHPLVLLRPHPLLALLRNQEGGGLLVAPAEVWGYHRELLRPYATRLAEGELAVILLGSPREIDPHATGRSLVAILPGEPSADELAVAIQTGFSLLEARSRAESRGKHLNRYRYELSELIEISKALTTEREIDKLLNLILEKARFITGADAGSIYVVEGEDPDLHRRLLRFKLSQNESVKFDAREFTVPISPRSIAGSAVLHRKAINLVDVYDIPPDLGYSFDPSFDRRIGYRTRSMLTAPLINHRGDVTGVLQLINKKRDPKALLREPEDTDAQVIPFDERSQELLETLASHAAIVLENALLYAEITALFEGFVKASVSAIEQRDPTTSGHSRRVADLTIALARAVELESSGPYRDISWTLQDLREIEYASLLHDFGKIGVREQVLVKAKKLYPGQLEAIRMRLDFAIRSLEVEALHRRLRAVERGASREEIEGIEVAFEGRRAEMEASWQAIVAANEPTVLQGGDFAKVEAISRETYTDLLGNPQPLLTQEELCCLSVPRGSLTGTEIDEIRSHVTHTRNFLCTIPWGTSLRRVPLIAGAHHERLDGTGYPDRLKAEQIPLQSKMMSISDIFDALTAADRPYKRAVPLERALDILRMEVKEQHVDGELFRIFCEAHLWDCLHRP
jgi:HD-GYP domain-containing protein (c-di-GMP phosphodiesterase class II)